MMTILVGKGIIVNQQTEWGILYRQKFYPFNYESVGKSKEDFDSVSMHLIAGGDCIVNNIELDNDKVVKFDVWTMDDTE